MTLRYCGAARADGCPYDGNGFASPGVLPPGARPGVDGVFEDAGNRPVVFRRDHQKSIRLRDCLLETLGGGGDVAVIVVVVNWKRPNVEEFEFEIFRCEFDQRFCEFAVDGVLAEASLYFPMIYLVS